MQGKVSLSILVPVYNEQYLVETSLRRLSELAESPLLERVRVIVVNDASTDQTAAVLAAFRDSLQQLNLPHFEWIFLDHEKNQGKGASIRTALQARRYRLDRDPRCGSGISPRGYSENVTAIFGRGCRCSIRLALYVQ